MNRPDSIPPTRDLTLSAGVSFLSFLALLVLAAADARLALSPQALNAWAYGLIAISLICVPWFCIQAWATAKRLGLQPAPWALLPLLTAPFGVWVAYLLLMQKLASYKGGE